VPQKCCTFAKQAAREVACCITAPLIVILIDKSRTPYNVTPNSGNLHADWIIDCFVLHYRSKQQQQQQQLFIMTRIFTILQKYIHIKLKKLDISNRANPQVAWANLGGPQLYLY